MAYVRILSPAGDIFIAGHDNDKSVVSGMSSSSYYEPHIQQLIKDTVKPNFRCLDIGANYGQHTVLMSKLAESVIAIEASEENFAFLEDTILINSCDNIKAINAAVWSEKTQLSFSYAETNAACSYLSTKGWHQDNEHITVLDTVTLDEMFHGASQFDFIKLDIEGSETFAIDGGKNVFAQNDKLLIELNAFTSMNFMGVPINDVIDKVVENGYNKQHVYSNGRWNDIGVSELKSLFDRGAVLIDTYFTK